jgi:hypothetical protein
VGPATQPRPTTRQAAPTRAPPIQATDDRDAPTVGRADALRSAAVSALEAHLNACVRGRVVAVADVSGDLRKRVEDPLDPARRRCGRATAGARASRSRSALVRGRRRVTGRVGNDRARRAAGGGRPAVVRRRHLGLHPVVGVCVCERVGGAGRARNGRAISAVHLAAQPVMVKAARCAVPLAVTGVELRTHARLARERRGSGVDRRVVRLDDAVEDDRLVAASVLDRHVHRVLAVSEHGRVQLHRSVGDQRAWLRRPELVRIVVRRLHVSARSIGVVHNVPRDLVAVDNERHAIHPSPIVQRVDRQAPNTAHGIGPSQSAAGHRPLRRRRVRQPDRSPRDRDLSRERAAVQAADDGPAAQAHAERIPGNSLLLQ